MRIAFSAGLLAGLLGAVGCGKSGGGGELVPVAGTITVDGTPAGNVEVTFIPQGDTKGNSGSGTTDSTGRYEVSSKAGKGLPPGKYKVVASRRLNPDGSPPDPDTPPIESKASETLPTKYTDQTKTELSVNIAAGDKRSFDFALKTEKEKEKKK